MGIHYKAKNTLIVTMIIFLIILCIVEALSFLPSSSIVNSLLGGIVSGLIVSALTENSLYKQERTNYIKTILEDLKDSIRILDIAKDVVTDDYYYDKEGELIVDMLHKLFQNIKSSTVYYGRNKNSMRKFIDKISIYKGTSIPMNILGIQIIYKEINANIKNTEDEYKLSEEFESSRKEVYNMLDIMYEDAKSLFKEFCVCMKYNYEEILGKLVEELSDPNMEYYMDIRMNN